MTSNVLHYKCAAIQMCCTIRLQTEIYEIVRHDHHSKNTTLQIFLLVLIHRQYRHTVGLMYFT